MIARTKCPLNLIYFGADGGTKQEIEARHGERREVLDIYHVRGYCETQSEAHTSGLVVVGVLYSTVMYCLIS
jgi:hypothetical protein